MTTLNVSKYIGKPYKANCRDGTGYDCYTLILAILRDLGYDPIDLFCEATKPQSRMDGINAERCRYERIEKPDVGCVVVMYSDGLPQHVGIYIGGGQVIHATEARDVVIDELSVLTVEGFYQPK